VGLAWCFRSLGRVSDVLVFLGTGRFSGYAFSWQRFAIACLAIAFVFTAANVPVDDDRGLFHNVVESVIVVGWSVRRECRAVHRNVIHGNDLPCV
jgi:hypothetical protein